MTEQTALGVFFGILVTVSLGILGSYIASIVFGAFPDVSDFFIYLFSEYKEAITGEAIGIHSIKGEKSDASGVKAVDLSTDFPPPRADGPKSFEIADGKFVINKRNRALLKGTLRYNDRGTQKSAKLYGQGEFIRKDPKIIQGFVSLHCTFEEAGSKTPFTWTTTCLVRRDSQDHPWVGFWIGFDRIRPDLGYFGTMTLTQVRQSPPRGANKSP